MHLNAACPAMCCARRSPRGAQPGRQNAPGRAIPTWRRPQAMRNEKIEWRGAFAPEAARRLRIPGPAGARARQKFATKPAMRWRGCGAVVASWWIGSGQGLARLWLRTGAVVDEFWIGSGVPMAQWWRTCG